MKNYREVKIGPYSAYAIAKKNGFEGTEEEWLERLKPPAVDKTLTEEGQAADAKVTGDALATKAAIDDTTVGTDAWSGKHIIDTLCPPISETGNPVQCYPVSGYPLGCKVSWEPVQEGSGTPYPAGGGVNRLDLSKCTSVDMTYGITCTIEGDKIHLKGTITTTLVNLQYRLLKVPGDYYEQSGGTHKVFDVKVLSGITPKTVELYNGNASDEYIVLFMALGGDKSGQDINLTFRAVRFFGDTAPTKYTPYENIRPIKGRDTVTVERCGENLIKYPYSSSSASRNGLVITSKQDGSISVNGTATDNTWFPFRWDIEKRLPMNTPMTLSGCPAGGSSQSYYIGLYLGGKWFADTGKGNTDVKFTTREIASRAEVSIVKGTVCNNVTFYPKIEVGTTITPYSKYQGSTNTLTLPHTICGGTVDAVTGEGQERWKLLTLDGTEPWNAVGSGDTLYFQSTSISIGTRVLSRGDYCTTFPIASVSSSNTVQGVSGWKTSLYLRWSTFADVAALKSYLAAQYAAGTPVQVCYKLTTPTPFTATGAQPIPALSGVNTVITDADSVTVTGRADPIKRITDLEDAVASMT